MKQLKHKKQKRLKHLDVTEQSQTGGHTANRDRDERQTVTGGQMDMPTARLEFWSQVDKHGGDCQVTRL